jgi:CRP/FNR family nitrogen fixation transcriptional regulator
MTAQQAISNSAREALNARTAWMAGEETSRELGTSGVQVHVSEGREIFAEGGNTDTFYKVTSGVVRVCKILSDGRRQIESFHVTGDVFGFELGDERTLSAEAVNDCTLIAYRRRNVETLAERDRDISRQLLHFTMESLAQARNHSLLLGRRGAVERVAAFLLGWARHFGNAKLIPLAMTRQDIADYLGLTIETVSRSLSQMERDGVILLPGIREVRLSNREALQQLAA